MTNQELIDYYCNLLIIQYRDKDKARGTVAALAEQVVSDQITTQVQDAFNLETAVGAQLDILGKYIGISRNVADSLGPVVLDDSDYRTMLKLKILTNNSGSSLYDIQKLLMEYFGGDLVVFDYLNMRIGYFFNSALGSAQLAEIFVKAGLLPKPMGVQLSSVVYGPGTDNYFSFRTYEYPLVNGKGLNSYESYDENSPFLKYEDAIII